MITPSAPETLGLRIAATPRELRPGGIIEVRAIAYAKRPAEVVSCQVALIRRSSWRHRMGNVYGSWSGTTARTVAVVDSHLLDVPQALAAEEAVTVPVRLRAPLDSLPSTAGQLVEINWVIRALFELADGTHAQGDLPIKLRSSLQPPVINRPPSAVERGLVSLSLREVSASRLVPGGVLSGQVGVTPKRVGSGRGIRVELVLREEVHRGLWLNEDPARNPANETREAETVIARQQVADHIELDPAIPIALPFHLSVPDELPAASLTTKEFTISYLLRAVLDRPLRPDPRVEMELPAITGLIA